MKPSNRLATSLSTILLAFTLPAGAIPLIIGDPFAVTDNFGPNSAGFGVGHFFLVGATVSDPLGVPDNISSVEATALSAGQPDYTPPFRDIGPIFQGLYSFVTPYTGQTGQWSVEVVNNQNESVTKISNDLDKPRLIPLATGLQAMGNSLAPTITWDPVFFDDDLDANTPDVEVDFYRIRLLNSSSDQFFRGELITGNSYTVPTGLIVPGVTHIRLEAQHIDGNDWENRSDTFTQFFAVPEPTTLALMSLGLASIGYRRHRSKKAA